MQKQETAIYVPVSAARAQWFFLNRTEAFRQKFDLGSDVLTGYKRYDDAAKAGRVRFSKDTSFAILSISINEHVRNALSMGQLLDGDAIEDQTSAPLWRIYSKGAEILANPTNAAMWVQFIDVKVDEKKPGSGGGSASAKAAAPTTFEPIGPTGFGC